MSAVTRPYQKYRLAAICMLLPLLAGGFCWRQWRRCGTVRAELSCFRSQQKSGGGSGEEIVRVDLEIASLGAKLSRLRREQADLQKRLMPLDNASSRKSILAMLDLVRRCELEVVEVRELGDDPRLIVRASGGASPSSASQNHVTALLAQFPDRVGRPVVQLRCRGEYTGIHRFFKEAKTLPWSLTPVLFDIRGGQSTAVAPPGNGEETWLTHPSIAPKDNRLHMNVIIAL
jgi:hypothetical protein